jgi:hypothetical protein
MIQKICFKFYLDYYIEKYQYNNQMELSFYQDGPQNRFVQEIIDKKHEQEFISYQPYNIDIEIVYTNLILRKVTGDAFFEWCRPRKYTHSFGKAQYYKNHKFNFEKIPLQISFYNNGRRFFNQIPRGVFEYDNIAISNLWIVINNPENSRLTDMVDDIKVVHGEILMQRFCTYDIEIEINMYARILGVDGIIYKDGKIYIPLLVHNTLILNDIHYLANIYVFFGDTATPIPFEIWGNICDTNVFPILAKTRNRSHNFYSLYYQHYFTGREIIDSATVFGNIKRLCYIIEPTYALCLMNISKARVLSLRLFLYSSPHIRESEPTFGDEYLLDDIEWFDDNNAIIWFNRDFMQLDKFNSCINFMTTTRPCLVIENTYSREEHKAICVVNLGIQVMNHNWGKCTIKYVD